MSSTASPARRKGAGQHDETNYPDRLGHGIARVSRMLGFELCYFPTLPNTRQESGLGYSECRPSEDPDCRPITRGSSGKDEGRSGRRMYQVGMVHMGPDPAGARLAAVREARSHPEPLSDADPGAGRHEL